MSVVRSAFLMALLGGLLLLAGCNHSPLGYDQLGRGDSLPKLAVPLKANQAWSYGDYATNNVSGVLENLELGKNYAYESRVLLRFALTDSGPAADSVDSLKLTLYSHTTHAVPYRIFPVTTEWDENQTTWHDAQTGQPWISPGGDFMPESLLATGTLQQETTLITLPIGNLKGLISRFKGLIVVPLTSDSGTFATIWSRSTTSQIPSVTYYYAGKTRVFNATENSFITDTLLLNLQPYNQFWFGSGYGFRTYLRFSVDSLKDSAGLPLPIDTGATVVNAGLTIHPESAFATAETILLGARRLTRVYTPGDKNPGFDSAVGRTVFIVKSDTVATLDIRPIVQTWFERPDSNFGLLLTVEPMGSNPVRIDIARVELKHGIYLPSLRINFVTPPTGRY